jgi:hypothetical protein
MWGFAGHWPMVEPITHDHLSNAEFYRARRIFRAWARADARAAQDWSRLGYLRRAGRPNTEYESRFRGVSEWIPETVSLRLVDFFERENR